MTSIEDAFSSGSSSSSLSSLSTLANNLPALRIESENENDSSAVKEEIVSLSNNEEEDNLAHGLSVPKLNLVRASIDSNFYATNINYNELENEGLSNLKKFIVKKNLIATNPDIVLDAKLKKPIVEFFDLETNSCRENSLVFSYQKNQVIFALEENF